MPSTATTLFLLAVSTCEWKRTAVAKRGGPLPGVYTISEPILAVLFGLAAAGHGADQRPDATPALAIEGQPALVVVPASFYAFTPTVFQHGERALHFSVENKPAWASFGLRHGSLYGVPAAADAGTYSNIIITVSDGRTTVRLPPFSIEVPAALAVVDGSAPAT
jgi:hypothetical protein